MITEKKMLPSIKAIQDLIIEGRKMSFNKTSNESMYEFLDYMEYLPALIIEKNDNTDLFEEHLKEICQEFKINHVYHRYISN